MAIQYKKYDIDTSDEVVMALLSMYDFESFEELDGAMIAYIPEDSWKEQSEGIADLLQNRSVTFSVSDVENINWNAQWEASFQPIVVDDFCCVRAEFHDAVESVKHDIIINPKMAFGTGHHETTYMMMHHMRTIDFGQKKVFDYGCGTGILSVLAAKLGACHIDAIDIEDESFQNTLENARINGVESIHASQNTLDTFKGDSYDIILANINRNVLLDSASELHFRALDGATIMLSGILKVDMDMVVQAYENAGFTVQNVDTRGEWVCVLLVK